MVEKTRTWARRILRGVARGAIGLLLFVALLLIIIAGILLIPPAQRWLGRQVSTLVSQTLHTRLEVEAIRFVWPNGVVLERVALYDLRGDTLFHTGALRTSIRRIANGGNHLDFGDTRLDGGGFYLRKHAQDSSINITELVKAIRGPNPKSSGKRFYMGIATITLDDFRFRMDRPGVTVLPDKLNYKFLDLRGMTGQVRDFFQARDTTQMAIRGIRFTDHSGLRIDTLSATRFMICKNALEAEDMRVRNARSDIRTSQVAMKYDGWGDLKYFTDRVDMTIALDSSLLDTRTLRYFSGMKVSPGLNLWAKGGWKGRVREFQLQNFAVGMGDSLRMDFSGLMAGLPNVHGALMDMQIERLRTWPHAVEQLLVGLTGKTMKLPALVGRVGEIGYSGNITGFIDDLVAYGRLNTGLGSFSLDMGIDWSRPKQPVLFKGAMSAEAAALDVLVGNPILGSVDFHVSADGSLTPGKGIDAQLQGLISRIEVAGSTYHQIHLQGHATPQSYSGRLEVRDSLVELDFDGIVAMEGNIPSLHFSLNVPHARIGRMHVVQDTGANVGFVLQSDFALRNSSDLTGSLNLANARFQGERGSFDIPRLSLDMESNDSLGHVKLSSPLVNAEMSGTRGFSFLAFSLLRMGWEHAPEVVEAMGYDSARIYERLLRRPGRQTARYDLSLQVDSCERILAALLPRIQVARGTRLDGSIFTHPDSVNIRLNSGLLRLDSLEIQNLRVRLEKPDSVVHLSVLATNSTLPRYRLDTVAAYVRLGHSNGRLTLQASTPQYDTIRVNLRSPFELVRGDSATGGAGIRLHPDDSYIAAGDHSVSLLAERLEWLGGRLSVDSLKMVGEKGGLITAHGVASRSASDTLRITTNRVLLQRVLPSLGVTVPIEGGLALEAELASAFTFSNADIVARLQDIVYQGQPLGALMAYTRYMRGADTTRLYAWHTRPDGADALRLSLLYNWANQELDGNLEVDSLQLLPLGQITSDWVQSPRGTVSGGLRIAGTRSSPKLNGALQFANTLIQIPSYGLRFETSDRLRIDGRVIRLNRFGLKDTEGHTLRMDGTVDFADLRSPRFDLSLQADQFRWLTQRQGDVYSGDLVATTTARLTGSLRNLRMNLSAKTERGTQLSLRSPASTSARHAGNLTFVPPSDSTGQVVVVSQAKRSSNLSLDAQLQVTPDARLEVVVDPRTGSSLALAGSGDVRLTIRPGRMQAHGDYEVQRGEFYFVLEGLLSRRFNITEGSKVSFNGDIMSSRLDVTAAYPVRTSLDALLMSGEERFRRRVAVECQAHITGPLSKPEIAFSIELPQADAQTRSLVKSALASENELTRQFSSLLILNTFVPGGASQAQAGGEGGQGGGATSTLNNVLLSSLSDLIFGQVNSWLSQMGGNVVVGLGVNYRPADGTLEGAQDETEARFSLQFLKAGVSVDANWDVTRNNTTSPIAGNFRISKQSNYFSNLRYTLFARSNDNLIYQDMNPFTAGLGLSMGVEFDSLTDLWGQLRNFFKKRKEEALVPAETKEEEERSGPKGSGK